MPITIKCPISGMPITNPVLYAGYIYDRSSLILLRDEGLIAAFTRFVDDKFTNDLLRYAQTHDVISIEELNKFNFGPGTGRFPKHPVYCIWDGNVYEAELVAKLLSTQIEEGSFSYEDFVYHPLCEKIIAALGRVKKSKSAINLQDLVCDFEQLDPTKKIKRSLILKMEKNRLIHVKEPSDIITRIKSIGSRLVKLLLFWIPAFAAIWLFYSMPMPAVISLLVLLTVIKSLRLIKGIGGLVLYGSRLVWNLLSIGVLVIPALFSETCHFKLYSHVENLNFKKFIYSVRQTVPETFLLFNKMMLFNLGKYHFQITVQAILTHCLVFALTAGLTFTTFMILSSLMPLSMTCLIAITLMIGILLWISALEAAYRMQNSQLLNLALVHRGIKNIKIFELALTVIYKLSVIALSVSVALYFSSSFPVWICLVVALVTSIFFFNGLSSDSQGLTFNTNVPELNEEQRSYGRKLTLNTRPDLLNELVKTYTSKSVYHADSHDSLRATRRRSAPTISTAINRNFKDVSSGSSGKSLIPIRLFAASQPSSIANYDPLKKINRLGAYVIS